MLLGYSFQLIVRKTDFTPKDMNSFTIQWNAVSDLSKCLPINFTLVPTIQVVCCYQSRSDDHSHFENQVSPHLVIQVSKKRHAHCKWPLIQDSIRCRQTFHALASRTVPIMKRPAHRRPSAHRRLFTVASPGGLLNHVTTIMTFLSFIKFRNMYCRRTIQFSQQQRALKMLQTPLAVNDRDKKYWH